MQYVWNAGVVFFHRVNYLSGGLACSTQMLSVLPGLCLQPPTGRNVALFLCQGSAGSTRDEQMKRITRLEYVECVCVCVF